MSYKKNNESHLLLPYLSKTQGHYNNKFNFLPVTEIKPDHTDGICGLWLNAVVESYCTRFQSLSHKQPQIGFSSSDLCHQLERQGGGYSLKLLFRGVFPHGERQRRSEEEHLALTPIILRDNVEILNQLQEISKYVNTDTKPYSFISKSRLNTKSDFISVFTIYRERERNFTSRNLHLLLVKCTFFTLWADKTSAECDLTYH